MSRYQEYICQNPELNLTLGEKIYIGCVTGLAFAVLVLLVLTAITYRAEIWELMMGGLGL